MSPGLTAVSDVSKPTKTDPFEDISSAHKTRVKEVLKSTEKGTFVETAVANAQPKDVFAQEPHEGQIVPTHVRVIEACDDLSLQDLNDYQNQDLCIWAIDRHEADPEIGANEYLTITVSLSRDITDTKFLVNCGGTDVVRKLTQAFARVDQGKFGLPFVASFYKKPMANGSRSFWVIS